MTFSRRFLARTRRGMALFQLVLYMGLVGVLIVGAVVLYQQVSASMGRDKMIRTAAQLRGATERAYAGHGTYAGLSMTVLHETGGVPAHIVDGATFREPLSQKAAGSSWMVVALPHIGGQTPPLPKANKSFAVMVAALDNGDCIALVSSMVGQTENRSGFIGARVRGAGNWSAWSAVGSTNWRRAPYTQAGADAICNRGDGQNTVGLAFR